MLSDQVELLCRESWALVFIKMQGEMINELALSSPRTTFCASSKSGPGMHRALSSDTRTHNLDAGPGSGNGRAMGKVFIIFQQDLKRPSILRGYLPRWRTLPQRVSMLAKCVPTHQGPGHAQA